MIRLILNIYLLVVFIDVIISYLPTFKNESWAKIIHDISEFSLAPIRKYIVEKIFKESLAFDVSPIILLVIVKLVELLW